MRSSKSYGDECFKVYRQLIDNYYHNLISIYVQSCMWKALVNLDPILRCFIYLKDFYPNQQYSIMQSPQYLRERSRIVQWETSLFDDARLTPQTPVTLFFIAACYACRGGSVAFHMNNHTSLSWQCSHSCAISLMIFPFCFWIVNVLHCLRSTQPPPS